VSAIIILYMVCLLSFHRASLESANLIQLQTRLSSFKTLMNSLY
jgi:hypothetical protein